MLAERWGRQGWVESCHSRPPPHCPCLGPGPCSQHYRTARDAVTNNTNIQVTTIKSRTTRGVERRGSNLYASTIHACCIYLGLWHTGGVCPLAPVLLCPAPPWVTEAWMIHDITSLATQTVRDTHPALAGLDSWKNTGRRQQEDH